MARRGFQKTCTCQAEGVARSVMKLWRMRQDMCTLRAALLAAAAPVPQPVAGIRLAQSRQGDRRRCGEGRGGGARRRCASSSGGRRRGDGGGWGAARRRAAFQRKVVKCYIPCVI